MNLKELISRTKTQYLTDCTLLYTIGCSTATFC